MGTQQPDTWTLQRIQQRIDAIRANILSREGRELSVSEAASLRRWLLREMEQEAQLDSRR